LKKEPEIHPLEYEQGSDDTVVGELNKSGTAHR
jgi:hypothetical protein